MFIRTQARSTLLKSVMAAAAAAGVLASGASYAVDGTATATGTVVSPIAVVAATNLNFGSFAAGPGGTITVSTSGARTVTGVVAIGAAGTTTAARFNVTGTAASTYSITHAGTAVLTNTVGQGETMTLTKFSDLTAANTVAGNVAAGTLDAAGAQSIYVGGQLAVAANQAPGVYTGTVIATIEYN